MAHVDRLAVVSRILLDQRVIDLHREIERLKLEVFWRDNSLFRLNQAMGVANLKHVKCMCFICGMLGRTRLMDEDTETDTRGAMPCKFVPWLDDQLSLLGFIVLKADRHSDHHAHVMPTSSKPLTMNDCMYSDSHFFKLGPDGSSYAFGERLWMARSSKDPTLQKLAELISMLESEVSDDEDDDSDV
jgi:hypothetical protein